MKRNCHIMGLVHDFPGINLLVIGFAAVLMILGTLQVHATNTYSQKTKLSIVFSDVKLIDVLDKIEEKSDFFFIYNEKYVDINRRISINANDKLINEILDEIFADTDLKYSVIDCKIILAPEFFPAETVIQQQRPVSGTVTDESGNPLPGVSVYLKGTSIGVITDASGKYLINDVPVNATLVFSFIGMEMQEIPSGNKVFINAVMAEDVVGLDEVVVVGYGVQKKANVTGSVTAIKSVELTNVAVPNVVQNLMGRSPGLFIKNVGAQPGDDGAVNYNIRGFGTPLIIIDGMPATTEAFNQLDPNDIESFSVLKDASAAAIYGARAGNGVIVATTKRGQSGALDVTYSSNYSLQFFTRRPEFVSAYQQACMENVAKLNRGEEPLWTDEQLQKLMDGTDPQYPNTDWWNATMREYAPQMQQNINIRGGNEKVKYFLSGSYFYQEGLIKANETFLNKYNLRSNIDVALTEKLDLGLDIKLFRSDYISPAQFMEWDYDELIGGTGFLTYIFRAPAYRPLYWPDATKVVYRSPLAYSQIDYVGFIKKKHSNYDAKVSLSYDLPLGIKAKTVVQLYEANERYKQYRPKNPYYTYNWETDTYTLGGYTISNSRLLEQQTLRYAFNGQFFLTWGKKFNDHRLSAMMVYEYLSNNTNFFNAQRLRYEWNMPYLFAGPDLDKTNNGRESYGGRVGAVSRLNYDYKGKYIVELNGRLDGSPLFPKESRWGVFPSVSLGWRLSEESFISERLPFIDDLKLRLSWGQLGYDGTSSYQYLETYSMSVGSYIFDNATGDLMKGIEPDAIANPYITWEKMTTSNVGVDFNLWNSKLEGSFDYFYRLRSDVLGTRTLSIPNIIIGAEMPAVNYARYDNRGWELSLNHRNRIRDFFYSIGGNIATNREKCVYIDQNKFASADARRQGNKIGEWTDRWWGKMSDGLFQTQEEIYNWADQDGKGNATLLPGDVKLIDYNEDGVVNNLDNVIIGRGQFPRLTYGINLDVSWKGFEFKMLWQGAGLFDINFRDALDYSIPFYASNTPLTYMWKESYTPENSWMPSNTTNAKWPIYSTGWTSRVSYQFSDFWLIKGDYLRLKNLELGYTLSENLSRRLKLKSCKIYVSGYNLLTFSQLDFLDSEADTNVYALGLYYPPTGTYNIGCVIKF